MKRTRLPASAAPLSGSMPPTSTWYEVPRCFACDDPIKSHRFSTSLLLGHTQYSHSSIAGKLGEYIGDGFVVVVTSSDTLCRNCMNLLNTMDRLEEELKDHRTRLVGNLRRKYGLDPGGNEPAPKLNKKQQTKADEDDDIIEIQSDEEWTPYNKKRKVTPNMSRSKPLTCTSCKIDFSDLQLFMTHLKQHKEQRNPVSTPNETKDESNTSKSFKCGCCALSFDKKETLALHMRLHTGDKKLNRPIGPVSSEASSLLKSNHPLNSNNPSKLYPKPTSETVVEMKLIMEAEKKTNSSIAPKNNPVAEKPVMVTRVEDKESGGKVCLLALWNSGSCSEHADCQNPSCKSQSNTRNSGVSAQQSQAAVTQGEMFIPRIIVQHSQDGIPQVVVSQPDLKISGASQSQFHMATSISQADTHIVTIPHSMNAPAQIPVTVSDSSQPLSHIVVSIPKQSSGTYNLLTQQPIEVEEERHSSESREVILNTSDNNLPKELGSDLQQTVVAFPSDNLNEQSSDSTFQTKLSNKTLDDKLSSTITDESIKNEPSKGSKSMPSLDDDFGQPVTTERTIIEQDEMGNIAIVNLSSAQGNETVYKEDDTDWFLASQQSNAILEAPQMWGNQDCVKSSIDQVDGMRFSVSPFEAVEQSDSVDENEKSEFFTSRYLVDIKQDAKALADALTAAIQS